MSASILFSVMLNAMLLAATLSVVSHGNLGTSRMTLITWSLSLSALVMFLQMMLDWPGIILGSLAAAAAFLWMLGFSLRQASIAAGLFFVFELFTYYVRS